MGTSIVNCEELQKCRVYQNITSDWLDLLNGIWRKVLYYVIYCYYYYVLTYLLTNLLI